jgi:hypothetical protein
MRVPSAEELAAIAAAYVVVAGATSDEGAPAAAGSRWRLAGRLSLADVSAARDAERAPSRWKFAGRVDD